ncbi:MAG: S-layer homology domain-containing protein, partial [Ruminiclostridium sp.]|nr:S-layer homology domain-containing protein [Ruminiclostridium sp.]
MAMSLSLAVTAGAATLGDYSDSEQVTAKYATAVDFASQLGILEGFDDGKYHPQGTLTRAQLATMVYRMTTADVTDVYTANFAGGAAEAFSDTPATAWYAGYVGYAADNELLKGLGDGTYAPDEALTGYAALAAFLRGVGYDEPGHNFVGAEWTLDVTKVAKEAKALEGISGVDLNKPITREVAAQMIYNIMFAGMVSYTPAFGYQPDVTVDLQDKLFGAKTLANTEFDIISDKDGDNDNIAPWGRPVTEWNDKDYDAVVTIAAEPVATYKTAVTECQIATDLGLKEDGDVSKLYVDGLKEATVSYAVGSDQEITLTDRTNKVGGQGTLTEIYLVDKQYQIVEIETWLGQITATTDAKYDPAGHLKAAATATLDVFQAAGETSFDGTVETDDFAKDDYVLVNFSKWNDGKDYKGATYYLTATAPVATAKVTEVNGTAKQTSFGTTT